MVGLLSRALLLVLVTASLGACSGGGSNDLQKNPWQWVGSTTTVPASQTTVPDPSNYTLTFKNGGAVSIKADCNVITGTYTQNGTSLTINTAGASTLAICPPGSLDKVFLAQLGLVASYETISNGIRLNFANNAGSMQMGSA
jgi:heat shock protein HslJ